jgi:hypothetical protein
MSTITPLNGKLAEHLSDQQLLIQDQIRLQILRLKSNTPAEEALHSLPLTGLKATKFPLQDKLPVVRTPHKVRANLTPGEI